MIRHRKQRPRARTQRGDPRPGVIVVPGGSASYSSFRRRKR
ncbi:hypothetical protein ACFPM0_00360 [Pseudonocardia sulfidoxydans]